MIRTSLKSLLVALALVAVAIPAAAQQPAPARPATAPITVPGKNRSPSRPSGFHTISGSSALKTATATSSPASTISCLATSTARARR